MWGRWNVFRLKRLCPSSCLDKKEYRIGGAGNVALNCHSLGSQVFILSVTGDDKKAAA